MRKGVDKHKKIVYNVGTKERKVHTMKYTIRDLNERAEHTENGLDEVYVIDNHRIALTSIWSCRGGRNASLVSVIVDGEMIATRCKRELGIRKALEKISA